MAAEDQWMGGGEKHRLSGRSKSGKRTSAIGWGEQGQGHLAALFSHRGCTVGEAVCVWDAVGRGVGGGGGGRETARMTLACH